jgi:hypothetical protein
MREEKIPFINSYSVYKNNRGGESHPTTERYNMESTIKLIQKMNKTLVEVIQFLDSNGHSNTDVRKKVDIILNFTNDLKEESKKEITNITRHYVQ